MFVDTATFRRLVRARELLADDEATTVREVARSVSLSPYHFIRVFGALYGDTPHQKVMDFPVGEARWITVAAPGREDLQLALEPNFNPAAKAFQQAMFAQQICLTALESTDLDADHARLSAKGVAFTRPPTVAGPVKIAVLSDTVGNLIQLYQPL